MSIAPQTIAALLGSRICHDLISPIGAISNGVELLQMSGGASGPEIDLISESVGNANARIRFFRIAFGVASSNQKIGAAELRDILRNLTEGSRLQIDWANDGDQSRIEAKLAFLIIQCLESAMPWGGHITLEKNNNTWVVTAKSDRFKHEPAHWQYLQGASPAQDLGASEVQFLLAGMLIEAEGRRPDIEISEREILIRF